MVILWYNIWLLVNVYITMEHHHLSYIYILVGGLEPWNFMTFHNMECHHPN